MEIDTHPVAISLTGITKTFGTTVANDHISLVARYGEVLALLGENGSGKTTLMNILSGIYRPDGGHIEVNGQETTILSPKDALQLGIGMIHQHFMLVETFTAMDNIVMGLPGKRMRPQQIREKIARICEETGFQVDPDKRVQDMSVGEKQTVEIVKVLFRDANILILDEPTAVLTPQETRKLFDILVRMKRKGAAIILITHKLNEVMELSDRVTILRKGKTIETIPTSSTTHRELAEHMVGHSVSLDIHRDDPVLPETILKVVDLTVNNAEGTPALEDVSFEIMRGEILGVAGVAGSGQKELCEALAGLIPASHGAVLYQKKNLLGMSPSAIIRAGISMSFVPEDRLGMGLVASMGITGNMLVKTYAQGKGPFLRKKPARRMARRLVNMLSIATPSIDTPVRMLSGGNVQKVLIGREIEMQPNVLITAYPVRGLDIQSAHLVYDLLSQQKQDHTAVMFIGEDLDVLLELCDRIVVLCHGKCMGVLDARTATKEQIGLLMSGIAAKEVAS